jgi:hypothetical protein
LVKRERRVMKYRIKEVLTLGSHSEERAFDFEANSEADARAKHETAGRLANAMLIQIGMPEPVRSEILSIEPVETDDILTAEYLV